MKKIYTVISFLLLIKAFAQNPVACGKFIQAGVNYAWDIPYAKKMPFMNTAKGLEYFLMIKPVKKIPVWLTGSFGRGTFAQSNFVQIWNPPGVDDTIPGNVTYKSELQKLFFGLHITRKNENARWQPYLDLKAGYVKFLSVVQVKGEDTRFGYTGHYVNTNGGFFSAPPDQNHPAVYKEKETTYCCGNYVWSVGTGVQFNLSNELAGEKKVNSYFDFAVSYMGGGSTCYTNDNYMKDKKDYTGNAARDPNAGFVNVTPYSIAEKKLAKLSYSPISMFNVRFGYVMRF